ncbi:hypothetical protein ScPMuIL_006800 [Solemya velum]
MYFRYCQKSGPVKDREQRTPLLLLLGYTNGIQIWNIKSNGEAQELLSLREGPIKVARVLPTPDPVFGENDAFASARPLIAVCDASSAGQPYCSVKFLSLRTGDEIHMISFKTLPVYNIEVNKRFLVVVFQEKLCVFDACQYKQLFWIKNCYPCPGPNINPVALGARWLAYADKRLVPVHQSCGGMSGDGAQSYAATVISAAKGAFKGLTTFGEAVVNSVTGTKQPHPSKKSETTTVDNGCRPGIVSVVDLQNITGEQFFVSDDSDGEGLIAHFHAHANEPVAAMNFDPSGALLITACKLGHNFHIFRMMAHPCSSSLGAVYHLYTLHRGDTTAKVVDMSFNLDSRWVAVSTHRGTTHVFPITPYGGSVSVRTHCNARVVNQASRFHKSAGLEEMVHSSPGHHSPVLSGSPASTVQYDHYPSIIRQNALNNNMGNPRLPPYPHPYTVHPMAQIKQALSLPGITTSASGIKPHSPSHGSSSQDSDICTAAVFSTPRFWVGSHGSSNLSVKGRDSKRPVDSLYVVGQNGLLAEYLLEPHATAKVSTDKVSDDTPLDLCVTGCTQWCLARSKMSLEYRPPLPNNSPLLLATDAVQTQLATILAETADQDPVTRHDSKDSLSSDHSSKDDMDDQWLSQVEIITHTGPHRRLWMGPQFSFKTYQNINNTTVISSSSSALLSHSPESGVSTIDLVTDECDLESLKLQSRSSPVAMPNVRPAYRRLSGCERESSSRGSQNIPLLIEAGSFDQSPNLMDVLGNWAESTVIRQPRGSEEEEDRLRETLADAMIESPLRDKGPTSISQDLLSGSMENLSTSSGSSTGIMLPRGSDHVLDNVFPPAGSESADSS